MKINNMSVFLFSIFYSGMINVLLTSPLWVANTRIKVGGVKIKRLGESQTQYVESYSGIWGKLIWFFPLPPILPAQITIFRTQSIWKDEKEKYIALFLYLNKEDFNNNIID